MTAKHYVPATEATEITGYSLKSLYNMRSEGRGPRSYKLAGRIVYDRADLYDWIAQQKLATASA